MKQICLVLVSLALAAPAFAQQQQAQAQSQAQAQVTTETVQTTTTRQAPRRPYDGLIDPFNPGWSTQKVRHGIGFGSTFMTGATNQFIYDHFDNDAGYSVYLGFSKAADSYAVSNVAGTTGTTTTSTTISETRSGQKNPFVLSLGGSYNRPIMRNDWLMVRWGVYGGVDYYFKTSYDTGTHTEVTNNTTGDVAVTDTGYGSVSVTRDPVFKVGPMIDTLFFLRWFPQLAIGMQGGIMYATPSKTASETTSRNRTFNRVGGVDQTPTSNTEQTVRSTQDTGSTVGTFAVAGTQFNLFGNFVLRYVW